MLVGKHADLSEKIIGAFYKVYNDEMILLELKAVRQPLEEHEAQLLNYLKATVIEVGLLLNFGPKAEFRRKVLDNDRKGSLVWQHPN
jgi:hypothetical protein